MGEHHLHALVELPGNYTRIRLMVGRCKQHASHTVRDVLPGAVWAAGGQYKRIRDLSHLRNAYGYIRTKQERGTVVWSHRDDENWVHAADVGIVVMGFRRRRLCLGGPARV